MRGFCMSDTGNVAEFPVSAPILSRLGLDHPEAASQKTKVNPSETRFLSRAAVLLAYTQKRRSMVPSIFLRLIQENSNREMHSVIMGRHGPRAKAKSEAALGLGCGGPLAAGSA